jgi:superfamily I DNA/RNA helicase
MAPGHLVDRLVEPWHTEAFARIPFGVARLVGRLTTASTEDELVDAVAEIGDSDYRSLVYDMLMLLRSGDINGAQERLALARGDLVSAGRLDSSELVDIRDGETIRQVQIGSSEYVTWLKRFIDTATPREWMLFMHPAQQAVVDCDFDGPAKLSGVSGSGKTCIIVKRAIRLAETKPDERVLVLTLNRPLAALISDLIDACSSGEPVRERIEVRCFFDLCREKLLEFEPDKERLYTEVTWKGNEHIDEIWREYYRCWLNNRAAKVYEPIHGSLVARGIDAETYLRQELDWVRTATKPDDRQAYVEHIERTGRAIPFEAPWRRLVLQGLESWERKMAAVGVMDQVGLAAALHRHMDRINREYGAVLVDEAQDFGTIELEIIRCLVGPGANDLFLCGDPAQRVQTKHQAFKVAGIDIPGPRSVALRRNYRNSREVLGAAHAILEAALFGLDRHPADLEVLNPELANFSSSKPLVLQARTLAEEIGCALSMVKAYCIDEHRRFCIAVAGYSLRDIQAYATGLEGALDWHPHIPVLDGSRPLDDGQIFLSDLEQTKGFEFDAMFVVNCEADVVPAPDMPAEERGLQACRLYVAMTRAKQHLLLSYSQKMSPWLVAAGDAVHYGLWSDYEDVTNVPAVATPTRLSEYPEDAKTIWALTGEQFVYTGAALGLSVEVQAKLKDLVDGQGLLRNSRPIRWRNVGMALDALGREPYVRALFGPKVAAEVREMGERLRFRAPKMPPS